MTDYDTITVRPLTSAIGATIDGVDATKPLPRGQAAEIRRALLDHLVIFVRGQDLTEDQQVAFAANLWRACDRRTPSLKSPSAGNYSAWAIASGCTRLCVCCGGRG